MEETLGGEEEVLDEMDGFFEIERLAERDGGAMETEEAAGFSVEDVMEFPGGRAEPVGEILAWQVHEIAERAEPPEFEKREKIGGGRAVAGDE